MGLNGAGVEHHGRMLLHQAVVQVHSEIGVSPVGLCMCLPLLWAVLALAGMVWIARIKGSSVPVPLVWSAGPQHPGPTVDVENCCEILFHTGAWLHI